MNWSHFVRKELGYSTNINYFSTSRFLPHGSITKEGYLFARETLQNMHGTYGKPSSFGLPDLLGKNFKLPCSQHRSYWCGVEHKLGVVWKHSYKQCSLSTLLIASRIKVGFYGAKTWKGFSVLAQNTSTTCQAQSAWTRFSLTYGISLPMFQPISRIARAVSFTCCRSNITSRVLAVIIGQASFAQSVLAESNTMQTVNSCYSLASNNYNILISFIWAIMEKLMLLLRILYLMSLFAPAVAMAPFVDAFGGNYRKLWIHILHCSLERAGPAFIKWGQWAATRPDLFPKDICDQMAKLHSKAPAHGFSHTKKTVESAFGHRLQDIFEDFEIEPVASGSIAQVHRAVLRFQGPGHEVKPMIVAVKVRHPGVREAISRDFTIINWVAKLSSFLPTLQWLRLDESVQQFAVFMLSQVDLAREAAHLSRFLYNFRKWKDVSFPKPLYPLVHPAVLVETFEQGESVAHYVDQPEGNYVVNSALANIGTNTLLKMVLVRSFKHDSSSNF